MSDSNTEIMRAIRQQLHDAGYPVKDNSELPSALHKLIKSVQTRINKMRPGADHDKWIDTHAGK